LVSFNRYYSLYMGVADVFFDRDRCGGGEGGGGGS